MDVAYHDPYIPGIPGPGMATWAVLIPLDEKTIREYDAVFILTDHSNIDYQWVVDHANLVVDTVMPLVM